jgi:hypothetical protein
MPKVEKISFYLLGDISPSRFSHEFDTWELKNGSEIAPRLFSLLIPKIPVRSYVLGPSENQKYKENFLSECHSAFSLLIDSGDIPLALWYPLG